MRRNPRIESDRLSPLAALGRGTLDTLAYLGGLGILSAAAVRSPFRPDAEDPAFLPALWRQIHAVLALSLPLVALVHVGIGSFLSMQAYFGGTFVDGTGAVVGVGLIRNLAPLMTGMTLAGLLSAWLIPELRRGPALSTEAGDAGVERLPSVARRAAVPLASAIVAGPVLTLWGVAVGSVVGWGVAFRILGVSTNAFFYMFFEMLWLRDVVGLIFKAMAFALLAALFACHEGLREPTGPAGGPATIAACRAACLSILAMLFVNSGWFLLSYHAGPAFGPTLMAPPAT